MTNERLRAAISSSRFEVGDIAHDVGVDREALERWIAGRLPDKRHRHDLASLLGADPGYLWPSDSPIEASDLALTEVLAIYPVRSTVGIDTWLRLFEQAQANIDVLVYAASWLSEDPAIRRVLRRKAQSGVQVRFLIGDPDCAEVRQRGIDEGMGSALSANIAKTIHNYRKLIATTGAEFRQHTTVLYNSIYRADDEMLINPHLYGLPARLTALLHLRREPGAEFFAAYRSSFERVWAAAIPLDTPSSPA